MKKNGALIGAALLAVAWMGAQLWLQLGNPFILAAFGVVLLIGVGVGLVLQKA